MLREVLARRGPKQWHDGGRGSLKLGNVLYSFTLALSSAFQNDVFTTVSGSKFPPQYIEYK